MADRLLSDDEVFGGAADGPLLSDDDVFGVRKPLPAGVTPSAAGAGRGGQGGPTADELRRNRTRRGTARAVDPYLAPDEAGTFTGPSGVQYDARQTADPLSKPAVVDQSQPSPPFTARDQQTMLRDETAPWKQAENQRMADYASGANAPSATVWAEGEVKARQKAVKDAQPTGPLFAVADTFADAGRGAAKVLPHLAKNAWDALRLGADQLGADRFAAFAAEASRAGSKALAGLDNPNGDHLMTGAIESLGTSLFGAGVGGMSGAIAFGVGQSGMDKYQQARDAGFRVGDSTDAAIVYMLAEYLGERISVPSLGRMVFQGAIARELKPSDMLKEALKQQGGEQLTQAMQSLYDKFGAAGGKPNMSWSDYIDDVVDVAKQTAIMSAVAGGAGKVTASMQKAAMGAGLRDRLIARAIDEGVQSTYFTQAGIDGFARAALTPGTVLTDPMAARPEDTRVPGSKPAGAMAGAVQPAAPAIRVEDMPTDILTPEQAAAVGQQAVAAKAAQQQSEAAQAAIPEAPKGNTGAQPQGEDYGRYEGQGSRQEGLLTTGGTAAVGAQKIPNGSLAAQSEERLRGNAQAAANEATTKTAAPANQAPAAMPQRQAGSNGAAADEFDRQLSAIERKRAELTAVAERQQRRATELRAAGSPELTKQADEAERSAAGFRQELANLPAMERPQDSPELRSFNALADAVERVFGRRPVAYVDRRKAGAADGFATNGQTFVNLAKPEQSVAFTVFHELQHVVRGMAERGDEKAREATRVLDGVWDMIGDGAKRAYAEQYLFRHAIRGGRMTVDQALASPELRDEMLSDFMGKRGTDQAFWEGLAKKDPKRFRSFARAWIAALSDLIRELRGKLSRRQGKGGVDHKDVDAAITELERAKAIAEDVVRRWVDVLPPDGKHARKAANDTRQSRRRVRIEDIDSIDEGQQDKPGNELGDEEKAALNDELDAQIDQARKSEKPSGYQLPSDEAIRAAGFMAEAAYPPLPFVKDIAGERATIQLPHSMAKLWKFDIEPYSRADRTFTAAPPYMMGGGHSLELPNITHDAAVAYLNRVAASIDLHERGFDLLSSVPRSAAKRVLEAWIDVSNLPGAATFRKPSYDRPRDELTLLKKTTFAMLQGGRYSIEWTPDPRPGRFVGSISDSQTGQSGNAEIEIVPGADRRMVLHTIGLQADSGFGKVFYQVALAFAHSAGLRVNADPSGLTGINVYRRTEQMMSAAVRAGSANPGKIGVGQRIYGWNTGTGDKAGEDNLVRLALAAARNATELVPEARDLTYDVATNTFDWRPKTKHGTPAEQYVEQAMKDRDVRAAGISRSTLARAAITYQAIDGTLDLSAVERVKTPILYSARGADSMGGHADTGLHDEDVTEALGQSYERLAGRTMSYQVKLADTGEVVSITVDAGRAMQQMDARRDAIRDLITCLKR